MNPTYLRKAIGGGSVLFGLWWLWEAVIPFMGNISPGEHGALGIVFMIIVVPFMATPGVLAIIFGAQLYRTMSVSSLKWVVGVVATFGAFWISSGLSEAFPDQIPEHIQSHAFLLVGTLCAVLAYLAAVWFLLPALATERPRVSTLIGRGVFFIGAVELWMLLSGIFEEYSPIRPGSTHIYEEPWDTLGLLVPIIVATAVYQFAASRLPTTEAVKRIESDG